MLCVTGHGYLRCLAQLLQREYLRHLASDLQALTGRRGGARNTKKEERERERERAQNMQERERERPRRREREIESRKEGHHHVSKLHWLKCWGATSVNSSVLLRWISEMSGSDWQMHCS